MASLAEYDRGRQSDTSGGISVLIREDPNLWIRSWQHCLSTLTGLFRQRVYKETPHIVGSDTTSDSGQPVLVRAYYDNNLSPGSARVLDNRIHLPPIALFSFASTVDAVDSDGFQSAIDAIAALCANSSLSLANAYDAHLPPQGEIGVRSQRPWLPRVLTAVPEAGSSSGSSSLDAEAPLYNNHAPAVRSSVSVLRSQATNETLPQRASLNGAPHRRTSLLASEPTLRVTQEYHVLGIIASPSRASSAQYSTPNPPATTDSQAHSTQASLQLLLA